MGRTATKVSDAPKPDKVLTPAEKAKATTRTAEQQAIIDRDKEALAKHDAENPQPGATAPAAGAPSSLDALKGDVLGGDAPRKQAGPAHGPNSHIVDGGDKVDGLATRFHQAQDAQRGEVDAPLTRRERAMSGKPMSEEDRRRALITAETGVDVFPRENGEPRQGEPTLQQCNAQYFEEEGARQARQAHLQGEVGDVLREAFGAHGSRRMQKNLR